MDAYNYLLTRRALLRRGFLQAVGLALPVALATCAAPQTPTGQVPGAGVTPRTPSTPAFNSPQAATSAGSVPVTPFIFSNSAVIAAAPLATLVEQATHILLGRVEAVLPPRWETDDGARPADPQTAQALIFAPVEVAVEQWLRGDARPSPVYLKALGGSMGADRVTTSPGLDFRYDPGERVVLFLRETAKPPRDIGGRAVFDIVRKYVFAPDGRLRDVYPTTPFGSEYRFLTWQEFLAAIAASPITSPTATR